MQTNSPKISQLLIRLPSGSQPKSVAGKLFPPSFALSKDSRDLLELNRSAAHGAPIAIGINAQHSAQQSGSSLKATCWDDCHD